MLWKTVLDLTAKGLTWSTLLFVKEDVDVIRNYVRH
jgi:hypothetical protein